MKVNYRQPNNGKNEHFKYMSMLIYLRMISFNGGQIGHPPPTGRNCSWPRVWGKQMGFYTPFHLSQNNSASASIWFAFSMFSKYFTRRKGYIAERLENHGQSLIFISQMGKLRPRTVVTFSSTENLDQLLVRGSLH